MFFYEDFPGEENPSATAPRTADAAVKAAVESNKKTSSQYKKAADFHHWSRARRKAERKKEKRIAKQAYRDVYRDDDHEQLLAGTHSSQKFF